MNNQCFSLTAEVDKQRASHNTGQITAAISHSENWTFFAVLRYMQQRSLKAGSEIMLGQSTEIELLFLPRYTGLCDS